MTKRLDLVDFLKGFSIFTIVVMHLLNGYVSGTVGKALAFGGAGVHVFILCSGFGLYLSHLRKPIRYGEFLKRRFLKVYIPYALIIIIGALIPFYYVAADKWEVVASHLFLYKMFFPQWEESMGSQMWFVSTIIQFYLCWPLIVKLFRNRGGQWIALVISLLWALIVTILSKSDERVWGSFFLQYLWEFVLGMWLASKYHENPDSLKLPSWWKIALVAMICMGITGYMGFKGGYLKMFNDIPSLFGYLSCALLVYKMKIFNRLLIVTNMFSYEWFLVHILIFACVTEFGKYIQIPTLGIIVLCFILSYATAWAYSEVLKMLKLK